MRGPHREKKEPYTLPHPQKGSQRGGGQKWSELKAQELERQELEFQELKRQELERPEWDLQEVGSLGRAWLEDTIVNMWRLSRPGQASSHVDDSTESFGYS